MRESLQKVFIPAVSRLAEVSAFDTSEFIRDRLIDAFETRWSEIFNDLLWEINESDRYMEDNLWHLTQGYKYRMKDAIEQVLIESLDSYTLEERVNRVLHPILDELAQDIEDLQ
mgnify:CR=1 FL=1